MKLKLNENDIKLLVRVLGEITSEWCMQNGFSDAEDRDMFNLYLSLNETLLDKK